MNCTVAEKMVLASTEKVVLGSIAFAVFWVLAVFPAVPFLPIGRTAGSLLGAMLMVIFKVITPTQAYEAIDLSILGLLFGTMVVSIYLERADMFKYLGILLSWKSKGAKDLLCRICLVSAISSAFFTNDTSCVVLTEFVLKVARQNNIPPTPFLLALASSANIGSSVTPIGNPQNLVIAIRSKISFGDFLLGILPAMLVGVLLNAAILLCIYWKLLSVKKKDQENLLDEAMMVSEADSISHRFSPAGMSHTTSFNSQELNSIAAEIVRVQTSPTLNESLRNRAHLSGAAAAASSSVVELTGNSSPTIEANDGGGGGGEGFVQTSSEINGKIKVMNCEEKDAPLDEKENLTKKWKILARKASVYLVTIGMLIAYLMGLDMSWTALTAALTLVALDFKDARPCLDKVSYSLLGFFCGMFITVEGFNRTGIPSTLWNLIEPHANINHVNGKAGLVVVILLLSNIVSNVPTVLLLGCKVAASAAAISASEDKKAWLILAYVSTVAGNLSLLGSAANLIVCEQARNSHMFSYNLSFWNHLKFELPSTLIVTAIGLIFIRG